MPDFFLKRYNSKGLKIASALIIFVFLVPYCASVYTGLSSFFTSVFGIPYQWCLVGMAVFTGMYLLVGGYLATALIDFVQGLIMIVGVVLMIFFVVGNPVVGWNIGRTFKARGAARRRPLARFAFSIGRFGRAARFAHHTHQPWHMGAAADGA